MAPKRKQAQTGPKNQKKQKQEVAPKPASKQEKRGRKPANHPFVMRIEKVQEVLALSEKEVINTMLHNVCELAFKNDREGRHPFEQKTIEMIGQAIQEIYGGVMQKQTEAANNKNYHEGVARSDEDNIEVLKNNVTAKTTQIEDAQGWFNAKDGELKQAKKANNKFDQDSKPFYEEFNRANKSLEDADESFTHVCTLKDTSDNLNPKDRKKFLTFLNPLLKKMKADESLVSAAPVAYTKEGSSRGMFDQKVIENVETSFQAFRQILLNSVTELNARKQEIESEKNSLNNRVDECEASQKDAQEKLDRLEGENKELTEALKQMRKKAKESSSNLSKASKEYDEAVADVKQIEEAAGYVTQLTQRIGNDMDELKEEFLGENNSVEDELLGSD